LPFALALPFAFGLGWAFGAGSAATAAFFCSYDGFSKWSKLHLSPSLHLPFPFLSNGQTGGCQKLHGIA